MAKQMEIKEASALTRLEQMHIALEESETEARINRAIRNKYVMKAVKAGFTQTEIAETIGVSKNAISKIVNV